MNTALIKTDRPYFLADLTREPLPDGVSVVEAVPRRNSPGVKLQLAVNLRDISPTAFSLWVLRKLRSIAGDHRLEIGGKRLSLHMPEAIDLVAEAITGAKAGRKAAA